MNKPFPFFHTPESISSLLPLLTQLEESTEQRPTVVMEETGNHSKPIATFFSLKVILLLCLIPYQLMS